MNEIPIRPATDSDLDWCRYTLKLDSNYPAHQIPGLSELFVAESGGGLAGALHLSYLWPGQQGGIPYISSIVVNKEYQGKGVGRAFLGFLERLLRERDETVLLSSCAVNEHEPQTWHRHVGFERCGNLEGIPFDDELGEVFFYKRLDQ